MKQIFIKQVVSCSSEDDEFPACSLIHSQQWMTRCKSLLSNEVRNTLFARTSNLAEAASVFLHSPKSLEGSFVGQAEVLVQLSENATIAFVDVENAGSETIEIFGREVTSLKEVLLVPQSKLMLECELRFLTNTDRRRLLKTVNHTTVDRLKIILRQSQFSKIFYGIKRLQLYAN